MSNNSAGGNANGMIGGDLIWGKETSSEAVAVCFLYEVISNLRSLEILEMFGRRTWG